MIRTRLQGDTPFFPNMLNNWKVEVCLKEDVDKVIREKDAEIASLKAQIVEAKELSIELQKRNKAIADNVIRNVESYKSKRDAEIESLKASHYADSVDAGMREHRLQRALWLARANSAESQFFYWCARFGVESGFTKADIRGYSVNTKRRLRTIGEWIETWKNVKHKCINKAELYK